MFCKWCGATITSSAAKCTRCGKDVPAMSDCGGFYDLVPGAPRSGGAVPPVQPAAPKPHGPRPEQVKQAPPSGKKNNTGLVGLAIACVGLLVMLVLILGMRSQINACLTWLEDNNQKIELLASDVQRLKKNTAEDSQQVPEETVTEAPKLEEQTVQIRIDAVHGRDGVSVKSAADLGAVEEAVTNQVTFNDNTNSLTGVSIDVGEAQGCIVAKFKSVVGSSEDPEKVVLSVAMDVDSAVFAANQGQPEYSWSYREDASDEWIELDGDVFTCEASDDGATVTFQAGDVDKLLDEDVQNLEFRLTYTRRTEQGGSLTLEITGITIPRKDLKIEPVESIDTILGN